MTAQDIPVVAQDQEYNLILRETITPGKYQNRDIFDQIALNELAESVIANGIIVPIVVRPTELNANLYTIVDGERRWRAAAIAGLDWIPCIIRNGMTEIAHATATVIANLQRSDLTPIEEASGFATLRDVAGHTTEQIAQEVGRPEAAIRQSLSLLTLPERAQHYMHVGGFTHEEGHPDRQRLILTRAQGLALVRTMFPDNPQLTTQLAEFAMRESLPAKLLEPDKLLHNPYHTIARANLTKDGTVKKDATIAILPMGAPFLQTHCFNCPFGAFRGEKDDGYGSWKYCLKPDHLIELQERQNRDAKAANEARIAKANAGVANEDGGSDAPTIPTMRDLGHENYVDLRSKQATDPPLACTDACPCRGTALDYANVVCVICTDPARHKSLKNKEIRAENKDRRKDADARLIELIGEMDRVGKTEDGFTERDVRILIRAVLTSITTDTKKIAAAERHILPHIARPSLFPETQGKDYVHSLYGRIKQGEFDAIPTAALVRFAVESLVRRDLVHYHQYGGFGEYMGVFRAKDADPPAPPIVPAPDPIADLQANVDAIAGLPMRVDDDPTPARVMPLATIAGRTEIDLSDSPPLKFISVIGANDEREILTINEDGAMVPYVPVATPASTLIGITINGENIPIADVPPFGEDPEQKAIRDAWMLYRWAREQTGDTLIVSPNLGDAYLFDDDAVYLNANQGFEIEECKDWIDGFGVITVVAKRDVQTVVAKMRDDDMPISIASMIDGLRVLTHILAHDDEEIPEPADTMIALPDPEPVSTPPTRLANPQLVAALRTIADKMQEEIDHRDRPLDPSVAVTRKRTQDYDTRKAQAQRLRRTQNALRGLATLWETGAIPDDLAMIRNRQQIDDLLDFATMPTEGPERERAARIGLATTDRWMTTRLALMELTDRMDTGKAERDRVRELESLRQRVRTQRPDGFFPTPIKLAEHLVALAEIAAGDVVLEPTAGDGAIAEIIARDIPAATLVVCERNYDLRKILELRGFDLIASNDFMDLTPMDGLYDRIVANFPFENHRSREMVRHAVSLLKKGGRIVAILAPNAIEGPRPADGAFRDWIAEVASHVEKLPQGSFAPDTQTGGLLVVIDRAD